MARGKKLKKKESRRREIERKEPSIPEQEEKVNHEKISLSSLFKIDEIQEITNILNITELDESNALLGAVVLGRFDIVKKLLKAGYSLEKCAEDGTSPLLWAVKVKLVDMADFLIGRGADANCQDGEGNNIFLLALQLPTWDQDTFIDFWLKSKDSEIDLNHANKLGNTVIHYMVKRQWDTALELVATTSRVNLNTVTGKGVTALMMACSRHQEASISTLLKYEAEIWIEDNRGCTALCYAIAYFIQKKLEMPNRPIENMLGAFERSKHTLNAYLQRRLELLHDPPENNFSNTVSSIIVHVITFVTRCISTGINSFLEIKIFKLIKDIAEKHIDDGEYMLTVFGVLSEILRFCNCCMREVPKDELFAAFYESGIPNICVRMLKKLGSSTFSSSQFHTILMPLFFTCKHPSSRSWLKKNSKMLLYYYKNFIISPPLFISLYPNDKHFTLVKKSSEDFKSVLIESQDNDLMPEEKNKKRKSDVQAVNKQQDDKTRAEKIVKKSDDSLKKTNAKYQDNSVEVVSPKQKGTKSTYWCFNSASTEFGDSSLTSDFGGEVQANTPTIYPNWQEDFKEGCELFGITEVPSVSPVKSESVREMKKEQGSGDMRLEDHQDHKITKENKEGSNLTMNEFKIYEPMVKELENTLNKIMTKYEETWKKECDEGYIDAKCEAEDYLKLFQVLPNLEAYYLSEVTKKWKYLVDQLKNSCNEKPKDCKRIMEELRNYLGILYKEANERYGSMVSSKTKKIEETKQDVPITEDCKLENDLPNEDIIIESEGEESVSTEENEGVYQRPSDEEWLRKLLKANKAQEAHSPKSNTKIICTQCRTQREPFYSSMSHSDILESLNQLWRRRNQFGIFDDIILPNIIEDSRINQGGNFGAVYIGLDISFAMPLAVKRVYKDSTFDQALAASLKNLIQTHLKLHSDYILPYTHCVEIKGQMLLATPLCDRNLSDYLVLLRRTSRFNLSTANMMIRQVIEGLHFLHSRPTPVTHGNLKPSNILVDGKGRLRLSEFGIGTVLYQRSPPQIGAVIWWSQETFWYYRKQGKMLVTKLSDIQVCGIVAHYIATGGVHPFGCSTTEIMHNIEKAKPILVLENEEIKDLVTWMITDIPHERPLITMVLNHVFFWNKEKRWRFVLVCAGVTSECEELSASISEFHECLDSYAKENNVHTKWVKMVEMQLTGRVPSKLDYPDSLSGLLHMLKDTLPSSASWFLSVFPSIPLTLYRLIENTHWMNHKDFSGYFNLEPVKSV